MHNGLPRFAFVWFLAFILLLSGCGKTKDPPQEFMSRLAAERAEQSRQLFKEKSIRWPGELSRFFDDAQVRHWQDAAQDYQSARQKYILSPARPTNGWNGFVAKAYHSFAGLGITRTNYWPPPGGPQWRPMEDLNSAIKLYQRWDPGLFQIYYTNLLGSIPAGSVFVSDTDSYFFMPGGKFLTLTANQFVNSDYLGAARSLGWKSVQLPTQGDLSTIFSSYVADAIARSKSGRLRPGENISVTTGGSASVGGIGAITQLIGLVLRQVVTNNPNCNFYYDEGHVLDWTLPYLVPDGLILKLDHSPVVAMDESIVEQDHEYWQRIVRQLTGLGPEDCRSVSQISEFAQAVYGRKDLSGYHGDPRYATNEIARQFFAEMRIAIAGVYAWRATNSAASTESPRMAREADFAFRQALALNPTADGLPRFGEFLLSQDRTNDIQILVNTVQNIEPASKTAVDLSELLKARQ